jgi:hypothetical protein
MRNKILGKDARNPNAELPGRDECDIRIDYRWGTIGAERVQSAVTELLSLAPVLFSIIRLADFGGTPAADAQHSNRVRRNCSPATLFSAS